MQTPKLMWLKRHLPRHVANSPAISSTSPISSPGRRRDRRPDRLHGDVQVDLSRALRRMAGGETSSRRWGVGDLGEKGGLPERASPVGAAVGTLTPEARPPRLAFRKAAASARRDRCLCRRARPAPGSFAGDLDGYRAALALIAGTSSCVMALSTKPRPLRAGGGPYFGAALPGSWLIEGGQSVTGRAPGSYHPACMERVDRRMRPRIDASPRG